MSFPAAFFLVETLELFCAEDHQINFVTSTEVSVLNGHHKQVAQAWLEPVSWLAPIQDLAGRAKAMRGGGGGKKNNNLWAAAVVCRFLAGSRRKSEPSVLTGVSGRTWSSAEARSAHTMSPTSRHPCTSAVSSPLLTSAWRAHNAACYWTDPSVRKGPFERNEIKADATLPWLQLQGCSWN